MNTSSLILYPSAVVTAIGALLLAAAIGHGIALGVAGVLLLYDAGLVGIIGFMLASFGSLGAAVGLDLRGEIQI